MNERMEDIVGLFLFHLNIGHLVNSHYLHATYMRYFPYLVQVSLSFLLRILHTLVLLQVQSEDM